MKRSAWPGFLTEHVCGSAGMKLNRPGQQIGIRRNDVAILADAGDFAAHFHVAK